ncbi:MAG: hypothetical protein ABFD64_05425 [Armatimonadota bacterium]
MAVGETDGTSTIQIDTSAYSHSIHDGADAHSQIFECQADITPELGIGLEAAKISDADGRTHIGNIYLRKPIPLKNNKTTKLEGYAGISWLSVEDIFDEESGDTGLSLGTIADYTLRPELTLYGRLGVAFIDDPLWTLDAGIKYELRPRWFLTIGYRGYNTNDSSLGGFLVGATYRAIK